MSGMSPGAIAGKTKAIALSPKLLGGRPQKASPPPKMRAKALRNGREGISGDPEGYSIRSEVFQPD